MKKVTVFLLFAVALTSGCAFSPHKPVVIKPDLQVQPSSIGQGREIWINVVDERPHSTLGTRGVRGIGAEIGVEGDLRIPVCNAMTDGLKRLGFLPVGSRPADGREIRVEIRNLDYTVIQGFWAGTLRTECGLKAVCILGNSRPFENLYRGEFQESIQIIQSDENNERYINSAVSSAINALLSDPELLKHLAIQGPP
jgi:uncharacterized lipoprotein